MNRILSIQDPKVQNTLGNSVSDTKKCLTLPETQFQDLRTQKSKEDSTRVVGWMKDARLAADASYKSLVQRVNVLVIVNGETAYGDFIDRLNVMISEAQSMISGRETKAAKKRVKDEDKE